MRTVALLLAAALLAPTAYSAAAAKKTTKKRTSRSKVPPPPKVSAAQRAQALESVNTHITDAMETGIQNAAAMVPFYEQMHRLEAARKAGAEAAPLPRNIATMAAPTIISVISIMNRISRR